MGKSAASSQDEVWHIKEILKRRQLRELFRAFLTQHNEQLALARLSLYEQIGTYRKQTAFLAHAHFLWQKFFKDDPFEAAEIPEDLVAEVKRLLWADTDGSDSLGLINQETFDPVRLWAAAELDAHSWKFRKSPILSEVWEAEQSREPPRPHTPQRSASMDGDFHSLTPRTSLTKDAKPAREYRELKSSKELKESKPEKESSKDLKSSREVEDAPKESKPKESKPKESKPKESKPKESPAKERQGAWREWSREQVGVWVAGGWPSLAPTFLHQHITGADLADLTPADLRELGLTTKDIPRFQAALRTLSKFERSLNL